MWIKVNQKGVLIVILILISVYILHLCVIHLSKSSVIQCFHYKSESLPNILESNPARGKSIFFHETSCNSHKNAKIVITARQACSVESAARLHPNHEIYLIYASPGVLKLEGTESDKFLQVLMSYDNVKLRHLDYGEYVKHTPVEKLWESGKIENSHYVVSHASDVLRYVTLWRYGGIYMDLDVIVIKSLENFPSNYAAPETDSRVNSAILNFSPTGDGHALATLCLEDLKHKFDGAIWTNNGPDVITRVSKIICGKENVSELVGADCMGNFTVYPREMFYPVMWQNWTMFFDKARVKEVDDVSTNSYILHVWSNLNSDQKIPVDANVAYTKYAKIYCPKVFETCTNGF